MSNRKIYYICFYADEDTKDRIVSFPSVWSKIDYIADTLVYNGYEVEIVSIAQCKFGKFNGYSKKIGENLGLTYLTSRHSNNKLLNALYRLFLYLRILIYLSKNKKENDQLLIYHSLFNCLWLGIYKRICKGKYILEIEDIFSNLSIKNEKFKNKEEKMILNATNIIAVNDLIGEKYKSKYISYGSYREIENYNVKRLPNRIVYAGVIEKVRKGAFLAVESMNYLPEDFELYILGFGSQDDVNCLKELIKNKKNIHFLGHKSGEEYYRILQSCSIGLSTHSYDEISLKSADGTFPSKMLIYMANGLKIVAQSLKCLKKSAIKDAITFYDKPDGKSVAKSIIKSSTIYIDTKKIISNLNDDFRKKMKELFKN